MSVYNRWRLRLGVKIVLLIGGMTAKAQKQIHTSLADGTAQLAIGTHALYADSVGVLKICALRLLMNSIALESANALPWRRRQVRSIRQIC